MTLAAETSETLSASCSSGSSPTAMCTWCHHRLNPLSATAPSTSAGFVRGEAPLPHGTGEFMLAIYLMKWNAQEDLRFMNQNDMIHPRWKSAFNHHNPRIQELNVDGENLNAHEKLDDLSDALALFITKSKLYAQPSLLISDIGLKSYVYATTDGTSANREFDHATNSQLIGSCTSAPQFRITTDNMSGGSQFACLRHEHGTRTDRWMTLEVLTCRECETSAATIQYLIHLNSILQQKLDELYEQNIAAAQSTDISGHDTVPLKHESVQDSVRKLKEVKSVREKSIKEASKDNAPEPAPNTDTESAGNYQEEKLMEKFNKMLVDCIFCYATSSDIFPKVSSFRREASREPRKAAFKFDGSYSAHRQSKQ